jgi:YjbE family integral membrane protein
MGGELGDSIASGGFWIALLQIIGVNIVLSGDNAVVIALAARNLPPDQQKKAVAWGSGAAVIMRIVLTVVAVELLRLPFLKIIGAALLAYIAVKLLIPEGDEEGGDDGKGTSMAAAVRTILLADLVMSLDNVIAVAAAAKGNIILLIVGLAISIPLVVFASRLLLGLMERFPVIIVIGAALLGWVAAEMLITDPKTTDIFAAGWLHYAVPAAGAIFVVMVGKFLGARAERAGVEISAPPPAPGAAPAAAPAVAGMRVVLAADGSPGSLAAVDYVEKLSRRLPSGIGLQVELVNVQRGLSGDVASFVPRTSLQDYHREKSDAALVEATARLQKAGISFTRHQFVGTPGKVIADFASEQKADEIIMGTRGLGTHTGGLLGSVTQSTLEHATVPVVVVH